MVDIEFITMEREEKDESLFVEYFGGSPYIKVLDFLIEGLNLDYGMTEIARGSRVGWSAFTSVWKKLLDKEIVVQTRTIGNARLFTLNKKNEFVKKILKLESELIYAELDKVAKKDKVVVRSK